MNSANGQWAMNNGRLDHTGVIVSAGYGGGFIFRLLLRVVLLIALLSVIPPGARAQFFSSGQDPASIDWRELHTPDFQVVYPEGFEPKAQYVANILDYAYSVGGNSLDHEPRKISVIIHNRGVVSNGFVAPAPHRMELFSTPPQDNQDTPWLEHLVIHEFRHVVQIDKLNQGLTRVLGYIFGEQANAVVAGLVPMWFLEGDAVISETVLTRDGRGRLPSFTRNVRARLQDSARLFSFDKMLLGSYRDQTPNHYELGYHITSYGRRRFGTGIWQGVENHVARRPYQLASFNLGLNRQTGLYSRDLYDSAMTYFDGLYTPSANRGKKSPARPKPDDTLITPANHPDYLSYRYPAFSKKYGLLALRKDYSHLPRIVRITKTGAEKVHVPGPMTFEGFSAAGPLIAWSERVPDVRWNNRSYSVVKIYNMDSGHERTLQHKTRWFAPNLSPSGRKMVAVKVSLNNEYHLVVADVEDGSVQRHLKHPRGLFLQQPVWSSSGKQIYVIGLTDQGKGLYRVNYQTGTWETVMKPVYRQISHLSPGNGRLFFRAAIGHKEQICALDTSTKNLYQVTRAEVNASDAAWHEASNKLYYADYQANGYNLHRMNIRSSNFKRISRKTRSSDTLVQTMAAQEDSLFFSDQVPQKEYATQPYRKWKHLFHFHSWAPFYMDYQMSHPSLSDIAPGITLFSQNLLSTAVTTLGYSYQEDAHHLHSKFTYKGWYPVLELTTNYGGQPRIYRPSSVEWTPVAGPDNFRFDASLSLPLNLSRGKNMTGLTPSLDYVYDRHYYYNYQKKHYLRGLKTLEYGLWFYSYQRMAYRDLMPKWGLTFDMNYRTSPFSEDILGNMFSLKTRFYLPGLIEDHGTSVALGYQKQNPELYYYSSYLSFPSGFDRGTSEKLYTFESEYVFPLAYPDWNIPSLLYVKRFKGHLFFDYASNHFRRRKQDRLVWQQQNLYSLGAELTSDFHLARFMFPFSAGLRYAYLPQSSDHRFELVFDVDFYRIYKKLFHHGAN